MPELHNTDVGAVIVDLDININYAKLCRAQLLLSNSNVLFLFGSTDPKVPVAKNISYMGMFNKKIYSSSQYWKLIYIYL